MVESNDSSLDDLLKDLKDAVGDIEEPAKPLRESSSNAGRLEMPDTTYPTEMNCSQVFDQLLKCYSLGGQIRNYYRYGEISYCLEKRSKLKFCLGTKLMSEEDRREKIRHWHIKQLAEQQAKRQTSEVVWKSREEPFRLPFREDSERFLNDSNN